jgi:hypothetical protein
METDLNLVLLKRCILSSWLRHGGNPAVNFSDAHWFVQALVFSFSRLFV